MVTLGLNSRIKGLYLFTCWQCGVVRWLPGGRAIGGVKAFCVRCRGGTLSRGRGWI